MPTNADLLLDSSVAVRLLLVDHEGHAAAKLAVHGRSIGLAGHAEFETFSVLTRLPEAIRLTAADAASLIASEFPDTHYLGGKGTRGLLGRLAAGGISGGAVYDGLVAAAALDAALPLATADRRAMGTYAALGVSIVLVN